MSDPGASMRPVVKAAGASSTAAVVSALTGAVRFKLYAVLLGPAGVGVVSQVQALANTLVVLSSLGVGVGLTREIAQARGSGDAGRATKAAATARGLGVGLASVLSLAVVVLARPLASRLLGDAGYAWLLILAVPTLVFTTLGRVIGEIVSGLRDYVLSAAATIVTSVVGLIVAGVLVVRFGLPGAAASIAIGALVSWLVLSGMLRRSHPELARTGFAVHGDVAKALLSVGAASLTLAIADQLILLALRARLIAQEGIAGNGLFQGVWGLSQTSLAIAVAFLMSYSFARLQEVTAREDRVRETNHAVRMILLLMAPLTAGVILGRFLLIRIFLSDQFLPAAPLFAWQAIGDLLSATGRALGVGVLAVASVRTWLTLGLVGSGTFLVAFLLLVGTQGILAGPQAWAVAGVLYLAATYVVMRRTLDLTLYPRCRQLAWASAGLVGGAAWVADGSLRSYALGAGLVAAWCAVAVRMSDVREVLEALRRRLGRS